MQFTDNTNSGLTRYMNVVLDINGQPFFGLTDRNGAISLVDDSILPYQLGKVVIVDRDGNAI